ncbi:MAG: apolipoprotein N-acyltransferase, partial [Propionibacterium sp.]|nr:apolipoprotein N-acyltransferase [Propionibacterium sp.]
MTDRLRALPWWLRTSLAVAAGAAASTGFAPLGWWPVLILAVGALSLLTVTASGWWQAALAGFGYGLGLYLIAVRWLSGIFVEAMLGLAALEAGFLAVLGVLLWWAGRSRAWPLLAAGCWLLVEYLFSHVPFEGF